MILSVHAAVAFSGRGANALLSALFGPNAPAARESNPEHNLARLLHKRPFYSIKSPLSTNLF